jgi:hypothetical protein
MTAGPLPMLVTASPLSYDWRGRGRILSVHCVAVAALNSVR